MECQCGGITDTDIMTYTAKNSKDCLEFTGGKEPDGYPCNAIKRTCKACHRVSVTFHYFCQGVVLHEGETLKPNGDIYKNGVKVRGLNPPQQQKPQKVKSTARKLW